MIERNIGVVGKGNFEMWWSRNWCGCLTLWSWQFMIFSTRTGTRLFPILSDPRVIILTPDYQGPAHPKVIAWTGGDYTTENRHCSPCL